jgi:UrcA family protein
VLSCNRYVHIIAVALAGVLTVSTPEPVKAAIVPAQATSVTVRFHSQDLDTAQGVAGVYRRIRAAAESVCGQPDDALMLEKLVWSQCVDKAIAGAVASIHSESLTAYRGRQIHGRRRLFLEAPETLAERGSAIR